MSGIAKLKNRVKLDGDDTPWGGEVVDLQYSINFEGTSSLSVTVANTSGEYSNPRLDSTDPVLIEFGPCILRMLPISYKKSKGGSKGRTLTVTFEDMSLRYLDKNVVLLKNQQLTNGGLTPVTMVMGRNFAPNEKGVLTRWWGSWKPDGLSVLYDVRDLGNAINDKKIPISGRFYDFLKRYIGYVDNPLTQEECIIEGFLRSDSGVLRSVLTTVCGELGVIPFWNNADGIPTSPQIDIKNAGAEGVGFLDYLNLSSDVDKNAIENTVEKFRYSCNVEDDSYEVSIKNSFLKGGIGSFKVNPENLFTGRTSFRRVGFQDKVVSPYGEKNEEEIDGAYEMTLLLRAAMVGPEFYKNYILQKLCASYAKDMNNKLFEGLFGRDQKKGKVADNFDFVDTPTRDEGGEEFPFGLVINKTVDSLYKGGEMVLLPCGYSVNIDFGGKWNKQVDLEVGGQIALDRNETIIGTDSKYYDLLQDESFMGALRGNEKAGGSDFIAILAKVTPEMTDFLENTGNDPIYRQLVFLGEHYARWYASGGLLTGKSFAARNYTSPNVQAYFSDLAVTETPLGAIYNRYKTSGKPVDDDKLYDTGNYFINWGGQAECGYKVLPANTILLPDRNLEVEGKDKKGNAQAFKHIISIRTFLEGGSDATPERTTCNDGRRDREVPTTRNISIGTLGAYKSEIYAVRTDRDLDLEQSCIEEPDMNCRQYGETILPGLGKSITLDAYGKLNQRRTDCDRDDNIARTPGGTCASGEDVVYSLPTDNDWMVSLYDMVGGQPVDPGQPDSAMAYTSIDKSNSFSDIDSYWKGNNIVLGLECVKGGGEDFEVKEKYKTTWGERDLDYWDFQLMTEVHPPISTQDVRNTQKIYYTYDFAEVLHGLRCAFIPNSSLNKISKIDIQDVNFDIGQLLNSVPYPLEYDICDDEYINLSKASDNLIRIMANYVDSNISPSLSRDFVISGFGFKDTLNAEPELPNIYEGLESMSIVFNENGIHTTVKMGNKRRSKFSAQLQQQLIVKGLAGSPSSYRIPNNVSNSFGMGLRTKI